MKAYLDGNALCVTFDEFVNLEESPAFFVELTEEQIEKWNEFDSCPNWGIKELGPCEKCEWCKEHEDD